MSAKDKSHDPAPNHDAEREQLVSKRKAKQAGASKRSNDAKLIMALALLAGGVGLFAVVAGPRAALRIFGLAHDDISQRTSQVDLTVDKETDRQPRLDFIVPGNSEPQAKDSGLDKKFSSMQDQLDQLQRSKQQSGVSSAEIQKLLASYNDSMNRKLDAERKAMADELARQRAEDQADKDKEKLEQKQRESNAVIVDDSRGPGGIEAAVDGATGPSDSKDLDANERFLKSAASSVVQTSVAQKLSDPSRTVVQGTIISAVLETAIDTELPGSIRAQVMQPVYSFDGTQVLMPSGTVLIGEFNNDVDIAQKRVLIAWSRAVTPEGKSIALGSIGTDTLGRAGTLGNVDNRYATKFGAAVLISAITAAPEALASRQGSGQSGSSGTTVNVGGAGKLASGIGSAAGDQGSNMLEKYLSLPPVIRIPQGEEIRIFTNRDLVFL
ncbi:TrbI/VirB10 family protein [Mesorhizobium sp. GbtcB19]|uniref:TrbI/VirB10 family protein n=1 Tax=Mesorhizobium sp. GbtcB19 TaxID=2824764 RepID=UPI0020C6B98F|nr:TrbI/VirB10 family protein [Mesorhizobium sp. GbtcB19]